jgi:hypothetical protein
MQSSGCCSIPHHFEHPTAPVEHSQPEGVATQGWIGPISVFEQKCLSAKFLMYLLKRWAWNTQLSQTNHLSSFDSQFENFIGTRNTNSCKQNISCTFDPRELSCVICKETHSALNAKTPITLVLSDQSFPPLIEGGWGGGGGRYLCSHLICVRWLSGGNPWPFPKRDSG